MTVIISSVMRLCELLVIWWVHYRCFMCFMKVITELHWQLAPQHDQKTLMSIINVTWDPDEAPLFDVFKAQWHKRHVHCLLNMTVIVNKYTPVCVNRKINKRQTVCVPRYVTYVRSRDLRFTSRACARIRGYVLRIFNKIINYDFNKQLLITIKIVIALKKNVIYW